MAKDKPNLVALLTLSIALVAADFRAPESVRAQATSLNAFYVATQNQENLSNTIWRIDEGGNTAQQVFTLSAANSPQIESAFPSDELSLLNHDAQTGYIPSDAAS